MDLFNAKKLLDVLIENAVRILDAGFGVNHAEAAFFDVIELLRKESALKGYFIEKAGQTLAARDPGCLDPRMVPRELVELAAHELRWHDFRELADKRIDELFGGDATLAVGDIARSVTAAYDDDWEDREFYERYQR